MTSRFRSGWACTFPLFLAVGCDPSPGGSTSATPPPVSIPAPAPSPPASAEPAPSASAPPSEASLDGAWVSARCGQRAYPRWITFSMPKFTARDLVSPCPAGTVCVWSGIVERRGTATRSDAGVALAVESGAEGPGAPFPASLALDDRGAPVETAEDGSRCPYERGSPAEAP